MNQQPTELSRIIAETGMIQKRTQDALDRGTTRLEETLAWIDEQPPAGSLWSYVQPFAMALLRLNELGDLIAGHEFAVSCGERVEDAEALVMLADAIAGRVGAMAGSVDAGDGASRVRTEEAMRSVVYAALQVSGTRTALVSRELDAMNRELATRAS